MVLAPGAHSNLACRLLMCYFVQHTWTMTGSNLHCWGSVPLRWTAFAWLSQGRHLHGIICTTLPAYSKLLHADHAGYRVHHGQGGCGAGAESRACKVPEHVQGGGEGGLRPGCGSWAGEPCSPFPFCLALQDLTWPGLHWKFVLSQYLIQHVQL